MRARSGVLAAFVHLAILQSGVASADQAVDQPAAPSQADVAPDVTQKANADTESSRFVFVPYPITEPAVGTGLLAGPVWMRRGPENDHGPNKPQAYGVGALWTDGGSRGLLAFDSRAWAEGTWRTTVIAGSVDLHLKYPGLSPVDGESLGFSLHGKGGSVEGERTLGDGPQSLIFQLFAFETNVKFDQLLPPELSRQSSGPSVNGLTMTWQRDTRDDVFTPSSGDAVSAGVTAYSQLLGSTFDAQTVKLKWTTYHRLFGDGVFGLRMRLDDSLGKPPFFLRPYISLRGVSALRYPGDQAASVEGEYRWPLNSRWDVLAFGGAGTARADSGGISGEKSVTAGGVGIRFKVQKLFGMTFGIDVARGPDGSVGYIQIGNAWTN